MCPHGRAYWRHLVNTTEPSVCVRDAFLCQITLTTCLPSILTSVSIPFVMSAESDWFSWRMDIKMILHIYQLQRDVFTPMGMKSLTYFLVNCLNLVDDFSDLTLSVGHQEERPVEN